MTVRDAIRRTTTHTVPVRATASRVRVIERRVRTIARRAPATSESVRAAKGRAR